MTDAVAAKHRSREMVDVAGFTTVRSQNKGVETTSLAPHIQRCHIGEEMVDPIRIRRVLLRIPLLWCRELSVQPRFNLAFVINTIEANNALQENVELGINGWILGHLVERLEDIYDDALKVVHLTGRLIHAV